MTDVCFYFQVHQPYRLRMYTVFDTGNNYFDDKNNEKIMKKVAEKCYIPANKILLKLIKKNKGRFKIAFSITGTAIEQMQKYAPEALESFKRLAETGCVEFLSETYHHSLAFIYSKEEFIENIKLHEELMKKTFNQVPTIFRHTELIYNNDLAKAAEDLGYKGILAEGADHLLGWRSPNYVYTPENCKKIKLLLKDHKLSDDIAVRFSNKEHPLTVKKFASWINAIEGDVVNLFMDYETFGEHQGKETGIFEFLEKLPDELLKNNNFITPSEAILHKSRGEFDSKEFTSWADIERDVSAWLGNEMQKEAGRKLYILKEEIEKSNDKKLLEDWRKMQTSDHFYYMCTKRFGDENVNNYFNPYETPYEAFTVYMNILNDIMTRLKNKK